MIHFDIGDITQLSHDVKAFIDERGARQMLSTPQTKTSTDYMYSAASVSLQNQ
jgi:hypothetical protein